MGNTNRIQWKAATESATAKLAGLGGRTRKLRFSDVEHAIESARKLWRKYKGYDTVRTVHVVNRGGFVPNSYKYRAESDAVSVLVHRSDAASPWTLTVTVCRDTAQRRPYGVGSTHVARVVREGQTQGTIVKLGAVG